MQKSYVYDGTFEGYLTVLYDIFKSGDEPACICRANTGSATLNLFFDEKHTAAEEKKYLLMKKAIIEKISAETFENTVHAFLSEMPDIEMHIYRYVNTGREKGSEVNKLLADDNVIPVLRAAQRVTREGHRMLGFVRFADAGGIYYAKINPDCNVLPVIIPHFKARFGSQKWIIHDVVRNLAAFYDGKRCAIKPVESLELNGAADDEVKYADMWKAYFQAMEIKSRHNLKLQRQLIPMKYRKNITEFDKQ